MAGAAGDIAILEEVSPVHSLRPINHRERRANWTIRVEDLDTESLGSETALHSRERRCGFSPQVRPIGEVAGQGRAREIIGRGIAEVDDDR